MKGLPSYDNILVDKRGSDGKVGFIQLNRPKALNSLCNALINDVNDALEKFNQDENVGCIVITGSEKAFAGNLFICLFRNAPVTEHEFTSDTKPIST